MKFIVLFLALALILFAGCVSEIKPKKLAKPSIILPPRISSLAPTNRIRCTTNCPVAAKGVRLDWEYSGTDPQHTTFRFYDHTDAAAPRFLLGTNKVPTWTLWFSNAPSMLVECVAVDSDMAKASDGLAK